VLLSVYVCLCFRAHSRTVQIVFDCDNSTHASVAADMLSTFTQGTAHNPHASLHFPHHHNAAGRLFFAGARHSPWFSSMASSDHVAFQHRCR